MGQAWWVQVTNNTSSTFSNSGGFVVNCFYQGNNLTPINTGFNNQYIEAQYSGSCFFEVPLIIEWYALPGTSPGLANFGIALSGSGSDPVNTGGTNWQTTMQTLGFWHAYIYFVTNGLVIGNFSLSNQGSGGTFLFDYSIANPAQTTAADIAALPTEAIAPANTPEPKQGTGDETAPLEGSDQRPPRK